MAIFPLWDCRKTKPIGGRWPEILNKTNGRHLTEHDLKKQSQFPQGSMNVTDCGRKDYENMPAFGVWEDNPKQTQFQSPASSPRQRGVKGGVRNECRRDEAKRQFLKKCLP
jgi:hypothetical protein